MGGPRQDVARFFIGRHALVPFPRPEDLPIIAEVCQSFVFDNGAFTVWKRGGVLDVDGYIKWVAQWCLHPGFDWALIPDVIEGSESENDALLQKWNESPVAKYGVPVWHLHESFNRLARLCGNFSTVALGSSGQWATPGTEAWWKRMSAAMNSVCDSSGRPPAKLHGLRMMNPSIFTRLPLASADSTNAVVNAGSLKRFGMYRPPTSAQRAAVIAERIESQNSAAVWTSFKDENELALELIDAEPMEVQFDD